MVEQSESDRGARVEALLAGAEASLRRGELVQAVDALAAAASAIGDETEHSHALGRAAWLAALVALLEGDRDGFYQHAEGAVMSLGFSGDTATAARVALAGSELGARADDHARVRDHGIVGLLEALARSTSLLLDLAEERAGADDPRWGLIDKDRDDIPQLLGLFQQITGQPAPLARAVVAYGMDPIESAVLAVLLPLSVFDLLAERFARVAKESRPGWLSADGIARVCFANALSRQAARNRMAHGGRLHREALLQVQGDPVQVRLEPGFAAYLQGAWVSAAGDSVAAVELEDVRDQPELITALSEARRQLERTLVSEAARPVVVFGRDGAGKRTLVRAAAATAGRAILRVRIEALVDEPAQVLAKCRRDALLWGAVVHVDLASGQLVDPLLAIVAQPGPSWVLTLPADTDPLTRALLRRECAELVELELAPIPLDAQAATWRSLLVARGLAPPADADLELEACRPGLVVGDLVDAINRASDPADAVALGDALTVRLFAEMERLAEPMAWGEGEGEGDADDDPSHLSDGARDLLIQVAESIEAGRAVVSDWGLTTERSNLLAPAIVHAHGSDLGRAELVSFLAGAVAMPPFRLDLASLIALGSLAAEARLDAVFEAAGRLGAIVVIEPADALVGAEADGLARAVARQLSRALTSVVLAADSPELPRALEAQVEWEIDVDPEDA